MEGDEELPPKVVDDWESSSRPISNLSAPQRLAVEEPLWGMGQGTDVCSQRRRTVFKFLINMLCKFENVLKI